jgi:hypothetical protein
MRALRLLVPRHVQPRLTLSDSGAASAGAGTGSGSGASGSPTPPSGQSSTALATPLVPKAFDAMAVEDACRAVPGVPDALVEAVCSVVLDDLNDSVGSDRLPKIMLDAGMAPATALDVMERLIKVSA